MERVAHDLTAQQWMALQAAWGGCAYCRASERRLQRDCVLAISRGGRYALDNVVPACGSCNASKCNDEVTGWLRRRRLDERTFLLRHREIVTALEAQFRGEPLVVREASAPSVRDDRNDTPANASMDRR